jgi:hypothetical protein
MAMLKGPLPTERIVTPEWGLRTKGLPRMMIHLKKKGSEIPDGVVTCETVIKAVMSDKHQMA